MKKENKIHLEGAKVYGPQDYEVVDELKKLKEENKKLQEEIENHKQNIMQDELEIIPKLEEENKKLKEEIEKWKNMVKTLNEYNKFRIEENKKMREELEKSKSTYVYDAKQVRDVC